MIMRFVIILLLSCLSIQQTTAQVSASLNGYASNMQSVMFEDIDGQWISDNLVHNRINFATYLGSYFTFKLEIRNRFMYGETLKYFPAYADLIDKDNGWQDLTWNLVNDTSFIINTSIDRLFLDFNLGRFQLTLGRQRINWGMNYVWNPNDIFNAYSFFDFDYVERPGSDAVRLQMYINSTSGLELVGKLDQNNKWSLATLVRFNLIETDFQFMGGLLNEDEYVIGTGFSGNLGPLSLSGELTYLDPFKENDPRSSAFIGGLGVGYNTPFKLFIQLEYLYNQASENSNISSFSDFYYRNLTVRDLSIAPHNFFANLSYPVTALVKLGVSGMYFPKLNGLFVGPSLDLSLKNDLDLSFYIQHFEIDFSKNIEQKASLGFLRLKWSF